MSGRSFVDWVEVEVEGGSGGNGVVSFRREKYVPRGGPDGGDGGDGGSVVIRVDPRKRTLLDFRYQRHWRAGRGAHGRGKDMYGRRGEDAEVLVPPGTVVRDAETGEVLADLVAPDDRVVAARGGRGGRGNAALKTGNDRAPRRAFPGGEGEKRRIALELKLLADVGLVGMPNAGKSTLISRVSRARPRIADYPFTTLRPVLGLVPTRDGHGFVMADIPGLIEGAHQGKGMGHEFLRHIERTRLLVYLLDASRDDAAGDLAVLRRELTLHREELAGREHLVVLNKCDLVAPAARVAPEGVGGPVRWISAATGEGLDALMAEVEERLAAIPAESPAAEVFEDDDAC